MRHTLQFGIGLHHAGLADSDRKCVEALFVAGKIQVRTRALCLSHLRGASLSWPCHRLPSFKCMQCNLRSQCVGCTVAGTRSRCWWRQARWRGA